RGKVVITGTEHDRRVGRKPDAAVASAAVEPGRKLRIRECSRNGRRPCSHQPRAGGAARTTHRRVRGGPRFMPTRLGLDPAEEALLADSVGQALLVVLDKLSPGERVAFVLHDVFAVPFEEIAPIVGRTPQATRKLASRARRRVRGASVGNSDLERQRRLVDAFVARSPGCRGDAPCGEPAHSEKACRVLRSAPPTSYVPVTTFHRYPSGSAK